MVEIRQEKAQLCGNLEDVKVFTGDHGSIFLRKLIESIVNQ
jgi:hypothetical protein